MLHNFNTFRRFFVLLSIVLPSAMGIMGATPQSLYVIGNLAVTDGVWNPTMGVELTLDGNCYTGLVLFQPYGTDSHSYFAVVESLTDDADDWSATRYGADTNDFDVTPGVAMTLNANSNSWRVAGGMYVVSVDLTARNITVTPLPDDLFVVGNLGISGGTWDVRRGICLVRDGAQYSGTVEFQGYNGEATSYFTLITKQGYYSGDDWDTVAAGMRYGAASYNAAAAPSSQVVTGSTQAWSIPSGTYKLTVDLANGTLSVTDADTPHGAGAAGGWPEGYSGVMLQGFYWDCFNDGLGWQRLTDEADEICAYFDVMWIPNFAYCDVPGAGGMGYHPVNWFTNFTSVFGTEQQFRDMMRRYRDNGMAMMAEVVINHRYAFPTEEWNGKTWHIGNEGITSGDQPVSGSGAPDTGRDWGLCADLDHTDTNVQANVKAYEDMLVSDLGFAGFRYDFVTGYAPEFIKVYNRHSGPTFSVGEYWDRDRALVAGWINGTAYQSAAFDFPGKFAISDAFRDHDMRKLVDATMADYGYGRYSVTFVDNHDTFNEDPNRFAGDDNLIVAANAFILTMPGTPCVFMVHWNRYKEQIKQLVTARKHVGISNDSPVRVLRSNADCYMAEVTGKMGRLVVKVGPEMVSPAGYRDSEIVTSGNNYCVWIKDNSLDGPDDPRPVIMPERLYVVGNLQGAHWNTSSTPELVKDGNRFRTPAPVKFSSTDAYFSFITTTGKNWDEVNTGTRISPSLEADAPISLDVAAPFNIYTPPTEVSQCKAWRLTLPNGNADGYDLTVDFATQEVSISRSNGVSTLPAIVTDEGEGPRYYNLMGIPVTNPCPGIYVRIDGGTARRVVIR